MTLFKFNILFFFLTLFMLSADCWFWGQSEGNLRTKRQTKCNEGEQECGSGECINSDNVCDGTVHCKDGSDENDSCSNIRCQKFLFRCKYGACINPEFECDGKKDCRDNSDETTNKCKNTSPSANLCQADQFACDNGDCIDELDQCDGVTNCKDGSDETSKNCGNVRCQKFSFRCNYGACVNSNSRCNGIRDCADNSDEFNCPGDKVTTSTSTTTTTTLRPIIGSTPGNIDFSGGCPLPQFPEYGTWIIYGGSQKRPGEIVSENTIIIVSCNTGFKLYPSNGFTTCMSTGWSDSSYKCYRTCSPITTTDKLIPSCSFNGGNISCESPYDGTTATFKCGSFYEDASLKNRPQRICHDGSWNSPLPNCEPVCGLSTHKAETLLIGGENVTKGDYPWQVGLYISETQEHICGGSVITPKITISAAHCFEHDDPNKYLLAAGKYYRQYKHPEDKFAQYSQIEKIIKHLKYNEDENEANDIAILILAKPFKFGPYVLPVCYDSRDNFDYSNLNKKTGVVVGWGFTEETKSPSETLKQLQVEYKSVPECDINKDFKFYYQPYAQDKICAGLLHQGKSACKGDSGGGLVFRDENDRYFIRGIVSVAPQRRGGGCNSSQLSLYTGVSYHVDMILRAMGRYP